MGGRGKTQEKVITLSIGPADGDGLEQSIRHRRAARRASPTGDRHGQPALGYGWRRAWRDPALGAPRTDRRSSIRLPDRLLPWAHRRAADQGHWLRPRRGRHALSHRRKAPGVKAL